MKVRLLNPSIYALKPGHKHEGWSKVGDPANYPVVVEADDISHEPKIIQDTFKDRVLVGASELDRVFNMGGGYKRSSDTQLGWWNNLNKSNRPHIPSNSWEPVGPFDYWNKLKASREVGETVGKGYL
ncbi:hypothetical protein [Escherichia coli]|uniref:hypothetical protein n=1 Tax=Escherichia coli TaxID=562 RepID=UPI00335E4603